MGSSIPGKGKILIVEDEFLVALQLEDILADGGHAVIGTVPDRASLCNVTDAPDVALVDLNLRDGLTGPDIADELSGRYGARVIYITANPGQIPIGGYPEAGFVKKPFTREGILDTISYVLNGCPAGGRPPCFETVRPS